MQLFGMHLTKNTGSINPTFKVLKSVKFVIKGFFYPDALR
jgi:hypothetical protein